MMIEIEGPDAVGKATQAKLLAEFLQGEVVALPAYENVSGQLIKSNLAGEWRTDTHWSGACGPASEYNAKANALVLQSLMIVNRLEVLPRIRQLRAEGKHVVLDRWKRSAIIYGGDDGVDVAWLRMVQDIIPEPDVRILIDVPPEVALARRPERRDRYERDQGKMVRVRKAYLDEWDRVMLRRPTRAAPDGVISCYGWAIVDGVGTVEEVHQRVRLAVIRASEGFDEL